MLLLIDIGNTRIKWALLQSDRLLPAWQLMQKLDAGWLASGVVTHAALPALAAAWLVAQTEAQSKVQNIAQISQVVIANVAGAEVAAQVADLLQRTFLLPAGAMHWFAASAAAAGVRNGYRQPTQLGCDRFASLIAARTLFPEQPLLVVTSGTATTIDALSADGTFIGGLILPGLGLMATSLARHTAQLPQLGAAFAAPPFFADHTDAAILSGCLTAQIGAIEHAMSQQPTARCILSGGAANFIASGLLRPYHLIDNLVLLGLQTATVNFSPC